MSLPRYWKTVGESVTMLIRKVTQMLRFRRGDMQRTESSLAAASLVSDELKDALDKSRRVVDSYRQAGTVTKRASRRKRQRA